jgi:hypothetical protein
MEKSQPNKSTARLLDMADELIEVFRTDPSALPKEDYKAAVNKVSVFENTQFSNRFQNLNQLKKDLYKTCLVDISEGGEGFKSGVYQIYFQNGQLHSGHKLFGDVQPGEVVYSIGLKNFMAFQGFKEKEADDLEQEEINCLSLYFIYSIAS